MRTKDQAQRVQNPATLLSELEEQCASIEYTLAPFFRLEEQAKEANIIIPDCFLRLLHFTSEMGGNTANLHTRLLDGVHKQMIPLFDPDGRNIFFYNLASELKDTYQAAQQEKQGFYLARVEAIRDRLVDLGNNLLELKKSTSILANKLPEIESKVNAEFIAVKTQRMVQRGIDPDVDYAQSLPKLIIIAKNSISFFKPYLYYFTDALVCLCEFFDLIYANQTPPPTKRPPVDGLTERERALIHCYKGLPPIKRGEPLYNDYRQLMTPKKRISYPNESWKKAKSLIESIERIKPCLTDIEQKTADNEIATIQANFS